MTVASTTRDGSGVPAVVLVVVALGVALALVSLAPAGASAQSSGTDVTISLEPSTVTLEPGVNETVSVRISDAENGIATYEFNLTVDPTVATIVDFDESFAGSSSSTVSPDGSELLLQTALGSNDIGSSTAIIADVTLQGESEGTTTLDLYEGIGQDSVLYKDENKSDGFDFYDQTVFQDGQAETVPFGSGLVASFVTNSTSPAVSQPVEFDASDSQGNILEYTWVFGDGGSMTTTDPTTTYTYDQAGTYDVTLTVESRDGSDTSTRQLTLEEQAPVAAFTADPTTADTGEAVTFDAAPSTGTISSYEWAFGDGETVTTSDPTTTHSYDSAGSYDVTLTVSGQAGSNTTTESVTVEQQPLSASFDVDPASPDTGETVTFDAGNTTGTVDSYEWAFGDGGSASTPDSSTAHTYDSAGTYDVTLTVQGPEGSDTITESVVVDENVTAVFEPTPSSPAPGETVTFDAGNSTGTVDSYEWTFGDGGAQTTTDSTTTHTYDSAGSYDVTLTVTGVEGSVDSTTETITAATGLSASFTTDPSDPVAGDPATFDASDSAGGVQFYFWDFDGDGNVDSSTTNPSVTHTYETAGTRTARLTVEDAGGQSTTTTTTVTVREPLSAAVAVDERTVDPGETVTFDAGASVGPIDSYEWAFGDGETATTGGAETSHSYDEPGTYTATVTAVAGDRSAGATVAVTVRPDDGDDTSTGQPDDAGDGLLNASEDADGDGAGFGPVLGLVGLGGAAYLLRRLRSGESDDATDRSR